MRNKKMDIPLNIVDIRWVDIVLFLIVIFLFILVIVLLSMFRIHREIEVKARGVPKKLKDIRSNLNSISVGISKRKLDLSGSEKEIVIEEAKKVSQLWKSRREQLRMGYWEKMEAQADKLSRLRSKRDHIEELIKRAKIKYHQRELDEESFREIVKDYQKQLMEINVEISELEKRMV